MNKHDPCHLQYDNSNTTLKDLLFPTLSIETTKVILTPQNFDDISQLCSSLYQTIPSLKDAKFKGHLQQLDPIDGLKLSTAHMMIRGGGVLLMPGGDILRMANNIVKLKQLQEYVTEQQQQHENGVKRNKPFTVVTVSMDDFLTDPIQFITTYLTFLTGDNYEQHLCPNEGAKVCQKRMKSIAKSFEQSYNNIKGVGQKHVTTGKHENRTELLEALRGDGLFGPILDRIELLVEEALEESRDSSRK